MTARVSPTGICQDFLATLERVYRTRSVRRDAFGRRSALPSEVARLLAQNTADPSRSRPVSDHPGFSTTSPSALNSGEG
jgi:hypothetical protein